ncbi:uncharacterized protein LOC129594317 [Paramacrobiotus metropolitanus]|uniref:uncharacterized protein LOC129594317 n=1 Tax=Paramacrobiotus metropolitanus TaxID=2943436 RepID=UPI002445D9DD|nr:uncharacterized protein LOC129594317 [Paramacrobiotus metropolitanus]
MGILGLIVLILIACLQVLSLSATGDLKETVILQYATNDTLNNSTDFIRQIYAYLLDTELQNLKISISSRKAMDDAQDDLPRINAVDLSITATDVTSGHAQIQQLLPFISQQVDITLDQQANIAVSSASKTMLTVLDTIKTPRTSAVIETGKKSFIIYDVVTIEGWNDAAERNDVFDNIRTTWLEAISDFSSHRPIVDLVITQDIVNFDGSHQITYAVNILHDEKVNSKKVIDNFLNSLNGAKISKLISRSTSDPQPEIRPFGDNGVRSFGFYDTIVLKYNMKSEQDYQSAMEDIRKNWMKVLGSDAWNVKILPKRKTSGVQEALIISYLITFTSTLKGPWKFGDLRGEFVKLIPNIRGPTYSASAYKNEPTLAQNVIVTGTTPASNKPVRQVPVMVKSNPLPNGAIKPKGPRTQPTTTTTTASSPVEDDPEFDSSVSNKMEQSKSWLQGSTNNQIGSNGKAKPQWSAGSATNVQDDSDTTESTYRTVYLNVYLITDLFRITLRDPSDLTLFMDKIDHAWHKTIGNRTEFAQIVLYDDAVSSTDSKIHTIQYVVVILSSDAHLDLNRLKTNFERARPVPPGQKNNGAGLLPSPYNFLVIKDTYPLTYSDPEEQNVFVANLQQLWINALGTVLYLNVLIRTKKQVKQNSKTNLSKTSYVIFTGGRS